MAVGREVFETCLWIGRFVEAWYEPDAVQLVYRRDVKLHLCGSARGQGRQHPPSAHRPDRPRGHEGETGSDLRRAIARMGCAGSCRDDEWGRGRAGAAFRGRAGDRARPDRFARSCSHLLAGGRQFLRSCSSVVRSQLGIRTAPITPTGPRYIRPGSPAGWCIIAKHRRMPRMSMAVAHERSREIR